MPSPQKGTQYGWTRLPKLKGKGPKLGRTMRHEIKHLFHELFEKASLLREVDPSFEKEMKKLGLDEPFKMFARAIAQEKGRRV